MSAGIVQSSEGKFPYNFPQITHSPVFVQQIKDRFIVRKKSVFQKPTYNTLQQSLDAMTNHSNNLNVRHISRPKAGCGLDWLEWHKVERLIKEICAESNVTITVSDQHKVVEQSQKQDEALGKAQRQDEALSKLIPWIEQREVHTPQQWQGFLRLAWQQNNQLKSSRLLEGILCRRFETGDREVKLEQLLPPAMMHTILSTAIPQQLLDS